jgi:HTH-type transcriptional regulator/antitoxin HipB
MKAIVTAPGAFSTAIRDARRRMGLTQAQLAELAVVSQPTLSNLERGHSVPSIGTLLRIVAAVDLELVLQDRTKTGPADTWEDD